MRQGGKWNAAAACGAKKTGRKGLSAGIATRKDLNAMLTGVDHECMTGNPRLIKTIVKAEVEVILMHVYGNVGMGIKDANFEMLVEIAAVADGGRRMAIAMGNYNIKAEELEASGILRALGLTLVEAENTDKTCTSGKGSCIDYALVTTRFVDAIVDMKAVKAVPWGPHYGRRIRFRTDIKSMTVPEIVRPKPIEEAVKELGKLGLTEPNSDGTPKISWTEAVKLTRNMVTAAEKRKQPEVEEYAKEIVIQESMERATWQYAEWSAAAELRLLSAKVVNAKSMSNKQMAKFCGRGLPWEVRQKPMRGGKKDNYIEEQAWHVTAGDAFSGDLLGMIAEILVHMMQRRSAGQKMDDQDREFLRRILEEKEGKEGMAGTMAKAAVPKERVEKSKKKKEKPRRRTEEEMDIYIANAMFHAEETMELIRMLATDKISKEKAAEARTRLKSVANILHCREKERTRKKFAQQEEPQ